jgi:putative membrane-bound dehydrogenase-like protein
MRNYFLSVLCTVASLGSTVLGAALPATNVPPTGLSALRVPPGFKVELAAGPELAPYAMFGALDERGRLFLAESSGKNIRGAAMAETPECRIRMIEDLDGDGRFDRSTIFAEKVGIPMGVLWHEGALFVASPPDLLRFDDTNGDGLADKRTVLLTGWFVKGTASLHGPFLGPDGWLYLTDGRHGFDIRTKEGTNLKGLAARIWRLRPDGRNLESFAGGGMDNPVEIVFTAGGEMIGTMTYFTNPMHGQRDSLVHWVEGGVYAKWHESVSEFKQTGELLPPLTKFARIAPSGLMQYRGAAFGDEYCGNLFSAQFNPHRVQRHVLARAESTLSSEDTDFLVSSDPDFHPCDVLEDADGSLLVIDTGAWYVDQCPLSRISKPEIRGGIYRVRREDAPRIADPRGDKIAWSRLKTAELAALLEDERPFVRDQAVERLVKQGAGAVSALARTREKSKSERTRCLAVWALFRIGTAQAQEAVRAALRDKSPEVRLAAMEAVGRAQDWKAVDELLELFMHEDAPGKLAAATAFGRIGDPRVVPWLIGGASGTADDRFLQHALIYALIRLADGPALENALTTADPQQRKAALIALDQMDPSPLRAAQLRPFLADPDADLRRAALWVAAHRPAWADEVTGFLSARLLAKELPASEAGAVREALLTSAGTTNGQQMVAGLLANPALADDRRIIVLDAMDRSALTKLPPAWVQRVGDQLKHASPSVRERAVALVRSRNLAELDPPLQKLATDELQPRPLRVAALGALVTRQPKLDEAAFALLLVQLQPTVEASARSAAAQVLMRARLTDEQLLRVAGGPLARGDALILGALLEAFREARSEPVGQALVQALLKVGDLPGGIRLDKVLASFPASVHAAAKPLLARQADQAAAREKRLVELEPLLAGGDVGRGRQVFFGQKAACASCHAIGHEGGALGPDLTSIGAIRSGRDLLEAIVFPSASFVPGYESMRVETADDTITGIVAGETAEAITLRANATTEVRIPRAQVRSVSAGAISVMPEGLDTALSREELLDLLAFLQSQNGEQWLQPQRLGTQDLRRQSASQPPR